MEIGQTIFVVNESTGEIKEQVIVHKRDKNNLVYFVVDRDKVDIEKSKMVFPYYCFENVGEAENFIENYKKEIRKKIERVNIVQDLFNAWAKEYMNEKDSFQKEIMAEYLKETFDMNIDVNDFYKNVSWDRDAKKFREGCI